MSIHTEHIKIFILLGLIGSSIIILKTNNLLDQINIKSPTELGLSYSPQYAQGLGLDPKLTYQAILTDLQPKNIRLNAYWNEVEPQPNQFDFKEIDYYINEAGKQGVKVVLAIGYKLPRWPECRAPQWVDQTDTSKRQERQLEMIKQVVTHFENNPAIVAWQVENEPLLLFGKCPRPDREFLEQEVKLVRSLTTKPIILTDSGELRPWITPMKLSDYFGTTLYRTVQSPFLGQMTYPLKPWFYRMKAGFIKTIFAPTNQKTIITELQAEPWADRFITDIPREEQVKLFPPNQMKENIEFAKKVGFDGIYLWGAEWWLYMSKQGYPEYWQAVQNYF